MKNRFLFYSLSILLILSLTTNTIGSNEVDIELPSNVLLLENSNPWNDDPFPVIFIHSSEVARL